MIFFIKSKWRKKHYMKLLFHTKFTNDNLLWIWHYTRVLKSFDYISMGKHIFLNDFTWMQSDKQLYMIKRESICIFYVFSIENSSNHIVYIHFVLRTFKINCFFISILLNGIKMSYFTGNRFCWPTVIID